MRSRYHLVTGLLALLLALGTCSITQAQNRLSANAPLAFGLSAYEAAEALGVPLTYVRGRAGDELFLALPNVKGSALANRSDGLYLQFHKGRLQAWKGDWGTIRP